MRPANRLKGSVWNEWLAWLRLKRRLRAGIQRMRGGVVRAAFAEFKRTVQQNVQLREQNEAFLQQHAEALLLAKWRLTGRRRLRCALGAWTTFAVENAAGWRVASRAVRAMQHRSLAAAFGRWRSRVNLSAHDSEVELLRERHAHELGQVQQRYETELQRMRDDHSADVQRHVDGLAALQTSHSADIQRLTDRLVGRHTRDKRHALAVEAFKAWLVFVESRWEAREKVQQNLQNLVSLRAARRWLCFLTLPREQALEMAIHSETSRTRMDRAF